MLQLIEFNLVNGGGHDCIPQQLAYIESFDELKNENFPDAKSFVMFQNENGYGHLIVTNTFEEIGEQIRQQGPEDWFEVKTLTGNRVLVRRSSVSARRSVENGTALTLMIGGGNQTLEVTDTLEDIRAMMKNPTSAEMPADVWPVEPTTPPPPSEALEPK